MIISFLLGAGVEIADGENIINLPTGNEYTYSTLFSEEGDMYRNALQEFYRLRGQNYCRYHAFGSESRAFHICVKRLAEQLDDAMFGKLTGKKKLAENKGYEYEEIYKHIQKEAKELNALEDNLFNEIMFTGSIEQYFSAICNRGIHSKQRYWKIVNYFWNSFFSIIVPITNWLYQDIPGYVNNKYKYILKNLEELLSFSEIATRKEELLKMFPYYQMLNKISNENQLINTENINIFTTNFTPFAKVLTEFKCLYLAGELSLFEADGLQVKEFKDCAKSEMIFPYMLTQVPVKPIICPEQVEVYHSFQEGLKNTDILIVLGYSLPENDTHILSFLKRYVHENGKKLIYYSYKENAEINAIEISQVPALKNIGENVSDDVILCFEHGGAPEKLKQHILRLIENRKKAVS